MIGWVLGTVLRRGRSQWAVFVVVALVCLITATLLATLAIQVSAAERFGVPEALSRATPAQSALDVDLTINGEPPAAAEQALAAGTRKVFGAVPTTRSTRLVSVGALVTEPPVPLGSPLGSLVWFGSYDGVREHSTLVTGRWPGAVAGGPGSVVEAAVPEQLLRDLRLALGSRFTSHDVADSRPTQVEVVGTFRPRRPLDRAYWTDDPLRGEGFDASAPVPYTSMTLTNGYAPLLVDRSAFDGGAVSADTMFTRTVPDLARLSPGDLDALAARVAGADDTLSNATARAAQTTRTSTQLVTTLDRVRRFRLMTQASVIVIGLLLLVLAVAALVLATRLLTDRRAGEQSLMRARGASRRQLLRLATVEALLVAVVTTLVAPPLGRLAYRTMAAQPGFARAGLDRDPGLPLIGWLTAAGASLLFVLILVAPLLGRPALFVEQEQARSRQDRRSGLQRSGVDVAILLLAGVAYWQLRSYGTPVLAQGQRLRVDPVLVSGPALALLAGSLVAVRLVPLASGALERLTTAGRRIVLALAAWEVSRRPGRAVGAVLLITMALAVGTFGLSYLDTWRVSQQDQADFQVGADARAGFPELAPLGQGSRLALVPGAGAATPAVHRSAGIGQSDDDSFMLRNQGSGQPAELVALDSRKLAGMLHGRTTGPGGEDRALVEALPRMPTAKPAGGVPLPGDPAEVSIRVRLGPASPDQVAAGMSATVRLVVQDARGVRDVLDFGSWPKQADPQVRSVAVPGAEDPGRSGPVPAGERPQLSLPLKIVAVQTTWSGQTSVSDPGFGPVQAREAITVDQVAVRDVTDAPGAPFRPVALPRTVTWHDIGFGADARRLVGGSLVGRGALLSTEVLFNSVTAVTLNQAGAVYTSWEPGAAVSGVITDSLLAATGRPDADRLALRVGYLGAGVNVLATVPHLPGTAGRTPALYVDAEALSRKLIEYGSAELPLDEWWAAVPPQRADAFAAAVRAQQGTALTRVGLTRELQEQPLRIGIQAALWLAVAAAAALAAVGFATHTTVAIRVRRLEFSQLRALGLPRRKLTTVVAAENLLLCLLGALCGVGIGVLLGLLVGPLVAMAADGGTPVPSVAVRIPWPRVGLLTAEMAALLALVLLVVTRANRRRALGAVLRVGDER